MNLPDYMTSRGKLRVTRHAFDVTIMMHLPFVPSGEWLDAVVESERSSNRVYYKIDHPEFKYEKTLLIGPRGSIKRIGPGLSGSYHSAGVWLSYLDQLCASGRSTSEEWARYLFHMHFEDTKADTGACEWKMVACNDDDTFARIRSVARDNTDNRALAVRWKNGVLIAGPEEDVIMVMMAA